MSLKNKEAQRKYQREYMKRWRKENPGKEKIKTYQERLKYHREYNRKNADKLRKRKREYYLEHKEYFKQKSRECYLRTKEKVQERWRTLRLKVLNHYGAKCQCCGETQYEFLAIDHKNNDGNVQRKSLKTSTMYRYIIKNNYPDNLQVLCHNCNLAKAFYGKCPHNDRLNKITLKWQRIGLTR